MRPLQSARSLVVAFAGFGAAVALPAQDSFSARVSVRDQGGLPIEGVQVAVAGAPARVETGADGKATVQRTRAGAWLHLRRIGFRPDSVETPAAAQSETPVPVVLERVAVAIAPVVVKARRAYDGPIAGFHKRKEGGSGRFFTAAEIDRRNPARLSDLFRLVPGLRTSSKSTAVNTMRIRGARCSPVFWLDGQALSSVVEFDFDALDPRSFEGIEIYSGPASVPVEFQRNRFGSSACGTVLLWSKHGERRSRPSTKIEGSVATTIASMVNAQKIFTDRDVDAVAFVDSTRLIRPAYPDSLFIQGIPGKLLAEFVVNASGEVDIGTFNVVTTTHRAFVDAVREALAEQRYIPARRQGVSVSQVVQQPFEFVPEPNAARRR